MKISLDGAMKIETFAMSFIIGFVIGLSQYEKLAMLQPYYILYYNIVLTKAI